MGKRIETILVLFAVSYLASCFLFASPSLSQVALPRPGEVIDQTNYMKYKDLFSEYWVKGFENGWGGFIKPLSVTVSEPKRRPNPKALLQQSEKNRGKFSIDSAGLIVGGFDHLGLPFPELLGKDYDPNDKDFVTKVMWNYDYRYRGDDIFHEAVTLNQRKGENIRVMVDFEYEILLHARLYDDPKPIIQNKEGIKWSMYWCIESPTYMKKMSFLQYKYIDPNKEDDMYVYVPSLRRAIRSDASQRSTPTQGLIQDADDYFGLNIKTSEFTYKFVREQKVLGVQDSKQRAKDYFRGVSEIPFGRENWELRDVYVIDCIAKDPRYPHKYKRIYLDKENHRCIYYTECFDRAGKIYKLFAPQFQQTLMPDGDYCSFFKGFGMFDFQFGMVGYFIADWKINGNKEKFADHYTPAALVRMGR